MELSEVRKKINEIDSQFTDLFFARLNCSKEVAKAKLSSGDWIYKPDREKEIFDKYTGEHKDKYVLFIKVVMQISRKLQYGCFYENKRLADGFCAWCQSKLDMIKKENCFTVDVTASDNAKDGLNVNDILLAIASTDLVVDKLNVDSGKICAKLICENNNENISKAISLCYMLYCETVI